MKAEPKVATMRPSRGANPRSLAILAVMGLVALVSLTAPLGIAAEPQEGATTEAKRKGGHPKSVPGGDGDCPQPSVLQKAIIPAIQTDQEMLNNRVPSGDMVVPKASAYDFKTIQAKGRHLFTTPFAEADGAGEGKRFPNGEGPLGPREADFNSNLKLIQSKLGLPNSDFPKLLDIFQPPFSHIDSNKMVRFSILRLNGLDSQSCFECHNSIGSAHPEGDPIHKALDRKPGTTGGPAGQASNAFINDTFPNPVMKFVRQPPHVFGTGYVIGLSEQISIDLISQKVAAYTDAYQTATDSLHRSPDPNPLPGLNPQPGYEASAELEYRDKDNNLLMKFGTLRVTYIGDPKKELDFGKIQDALLGNAETDLSADFKEDDSGLKGVSRDLVIRPLQWKGIASNERNFVRSALNFHFGMLPRELNPYYLQDQEQHDSDNDTVEDDIREGDVSTLSIFTMSIRPPGRQIPTDPAHKMRVERGEKLFLGEQVDDHTIVIGPSNSCASCHIQKLPLYKSEICVRDPRGDKGAGLDKVTTLVARQRSSRQLPIYRLMRARIREARKDRPKALDVREMKLQDKAPKARIAALARAVREVVDEPVGCPTAGYAFDLNMAEGSENESLSYSYPRLVSTMHNDAPLIQVPLFSDLKRHDMGEGLTDEFDQPTDVDAIAVPRREFLTRPLWGVADTGPWLHDGRARTLRDAILMHASLGSEANPAIDQFKTLTCDDQAAIIEFLLTLKLPIDCRYGPCFDHPADCHPAPEPVQGKPASK